MIDEPDDRSYFFGKRPDKTYVSKAFPSRLGTKLRIVSKVIDGDEGLRIGTVGDEVVLRTTPARRYEIKATVVEDDRAIRTLVIQRYNRVSGPHDYQYFAFVGPEIDALLNWVAGIKSMPLKDGSKVHLTDEVLRDLVLNRMQARRLLSQHEELFLELAQSEDLPRDLIAVGYRRKQLDRTPHQRRLLLVGAVPPECQSGRAVAKIFRGEHLDLRVRALLPVRDGPGPAQAGAGRSWARPGRSGKEN